MRPVAAVFAAVALFGACHGTAAARQVSTTLTVVSLPSQKATDATYGPGDLVYGKAIHEAVTATLNEWGVDFLTLSAAALPTGKMTWLGTGKFVLGPDTVTTQAVLHERGVRRSATVDYPQYRPDSLLANNRLPSVPQLFLMDPHPAFSVWASSALCSLGTANGTTSGPPLSGGSGVGHECEACLYARGQEGRFFPTFANVGVALDLAHQPLGGVLGLGGIYTNEVSDIQGAIGAMPTGGDLMGFGVLNAANRPARYANPDTVFLWKRTESGVTTTDASGATVSAAQLIFCGVSAGYGDETANTGRSEISYQNLMCALAALDSVMGGTLLGSRDGSRRYHKAGLALSGGWARSDQHTYKSGMYLPDSAYVKAKLDSIGTRIRKYDVGANVDSVTAYPYEHAWYTGEPRFSPQVWTATNTNVSGAASRYWLHDLFGRVRARTAYRPLAASDTTIFAGWMYAFARCDSLFGRQSGRFILPPFDDYVPASGASGDSALIAASLAGASGVLISGIDTLRYSQQTTNRQQWFRDRDFRLIAHCGEIVTGGSRLISTGDGTFDPGGPYLVSDSGYSYHPFCQIADRFVVGLVRGGAGGIGSTLGTTILGGAGTSTFFEQGGSSVQPNARGGLTWRDPNKYANGWSMGSRGSVLKVHMSSLGGYTRVSGLKQPTGEAMSPGWWAVAHADGFIRALNKLAGDNLVSWDYPENIAP